MKVLNYLTLAVLCFTISACSNDSLEEPNVEENQISLTSPSGLVIAESIEELKGFLYENIRTSLKLEEVEFDITDINYVEDDVYTVATIDYTTKNGISTNIVYVVEGTRQFERGKFDTNLRSTDCTYTVSCSGNTCICQPKTILSNPPSFECTGSCTCTMTLTTSCPDDEE